MTTDFTDAGTEQDLDVVDEPQDEQPEPTAKPKKPRVSMTRETVPAKGLHRLDDGHSVLDGSVWHTPKTGSPTECEIPTCDRVLGSWRDYDPIAAMTSDDPEDPNGDETDETTGDAGDQPEPQAA